MLDAWYLMLDACQVDAALPPCSALERIAPRHAHRWNRPMWSKNSWTQLPWNLSDNPAMNPTEATCPCCPKHSHIFWNPGNLPWRQNCPHPRRKGTLVHPQIIKIRHLLNLRNLNIQIFGNISPPHHRSFKHWVSLHYFFACSVVRILFSATKNASARGRKSSANLRLPPPFQLDNQRQHTT